MILQTHSPLYLITKQCCRSRWVASFSSQLRTGTTPCRCQHIHDANTWLMRSTPHLAGYRFSFLTIEILVVKQVLAHDKDQGSPAGKSSAHTWPSNTNQRLFQFLLESTPPSPRAF